MSKPKSGRSVENDPITQAWHILVDSLRRLPTIQKTSLEVPEDADDLERELRSAQKEKRQLDDAYEQIVRLQRLRRSMEQGDGDGVLGSGKTGGVAHMPVVNVLRDSTPTSTGHGQGKGEGSGGALSAGVKRKRDRRPSFSASPAPPETTTSRSGTGQKGLSAGQTGSTPSATVVAGSASPMPRGGTPMSRQVTSKERYGEALPLLPKRKVIFKQKPADGAGGVEGEWIMGVILQCIGGDKNRYTVQDADDPNTKVNTTLRSLIPLPDRSLPTSSPSHPNNIDIPPRTAVLGLYPDTTSFYRGIVRGVETSRDKAGKKAYQVSFEEDTQEFQMVQDDMIVVYPPS